ncbi:MAG: type III toxin-antitoxin system ToxN/AbiQ family toxin, partial [Lachnospiraceae bacterium]|jgi:protein AbiQ|nr:type III toxin-antitoxin system ToxN/AbiQ family toxin [Lachnospiraceae bacterium]
MLKLYAVSDEYIRYLRVDNQIIHVFDNKEGHRTHDRKYVGVVISINDYQYFAPLSSPKNSDYINEQIRPSNKSIMRMTKNESGNPVLLGTLKLLNMIPVPASELVLYDVDSETDDKYKSLIEDEIRWIEHNDTRILQNAKIIYNLKIHESERRTERNSRMLDAILPFLTLEDLYTRWVNGATEQRSQDSNESQSQEQ